ncbi:MAG: hypothetical protein HFH37_03940 [Lachnospiraceae bacterium]|jgi:DNA-directed RNA polymerase, sigma subunit (sigma70/sigma32)|nr:hypothetical protein [Lachnospiraceae bacterium]
MVDKITFMETLHSVQEIAKASPVPLTKEEIRSYFQDMDLSEEQQEMIYQFLLTPQEEALENEDDNEQTDSQAEAKSYKRARSKSAAKPADTSQNPHFQMYLKEISAVAILTKEQQTVLYCKLLSGEETAIEEISHQWLKKIIKIAGEFVTPRVFLEDLVQEGNIALLLGLGQLLGKASEYGTDNADVLDDAQRKRLEKRLERFVREGMEHYRQELEGEADSENTILAKVSLIHEARKALAEENGTDPTVQELCEYTRIPQEEIVDILDLHEKARKE